MVPDNRRVGKLAIPDMALLLPPLPSLAGEAAEQPGGTEQWPCPQALLCLLPRLTSLRELECNSRTGDQQWLLEEVGCVLRRLSEVAPGVMAGFGVLSVTNNETEEEYHPDTDLGSVRISSAVTAPIASALPGLQVGMSEHVMPGKCHAWQGVLWGPPDRCCLRVNSLSEHVMLGRPGAGLGPQMCMNAVELLWGKHQSPARVPQVNSRPWIIASGSGGQARNWGCQSFPGSGGWAYRVDGGPF